MSEEKFDAIIVGGGLAGAAQLLRIFLPMPEWKSFWRTAAISAAPKT